MTKENMLEYVEPAAPVKGSFFILLCNERVCVTYSGVCESTHEHKYRNTLMYVTELVERFFYCVFVYKTDTFERLIRTD